MPKHQYKKGDRVRLRFGAFDYLSLTSKADAKASLGVLTVSLVAAVTFDKDEAGQVLFLAELHNQVVTDDLVKLVRKHSPGKRGKTK